MKTESNTHYTVSTEGFGGHYSPTGYSKYNERWSKSLKENILPWDVYGYEQALEHIEELREHIYNGKKHLENANFIINIVTTITTVIPIPNPKTVL